MITKKKKREELQYLRDEALQAYQNRPDFQYDANVDALYRHYKDRYTELGKKAMTDTVSQAAALTGGYGSSYAQNVGQQAYQSYLGQLDDVIPALYQLAYDRYQDKGNDLYKTYQSWAQLEQQATQQEQWAAQQAAQQEQWKARQEQWAAQQAALQEQWTAQQALQQERWAAQQALQKEQWEREYELKKRKLQEANRRIQQEQERKNSQTQTGTSQPDYWAMLSYHQNLGQRTQSQKAAAKPNYDNGNVSEGNIKTMQRVLGLQETGKWAENEYQKAGSLNADDAWLSYQKGQLQNRHSHGQWEQGATVGNIKTMERVLGLEEDGYWSEKDQKTAGGQTAFAAWKDYQQGKLQSRSRSGVSMEKWAAYQSKQSKASGVSNTKENTAAVQSFISNMMTKEQAAKRGITSKEWEAMVADRLNHVDLSVDEFEQLEKHYGLDIDDGKSGTTGTVNSSAQKLSYAQYRQKTAAKKVADYQTAVQRYFKDYQAFTNSAVYDSQNVDYHNATSMLESRIQTASELRKRADTLLTSLETSEDILAGDYSELLELLASTQKGIDSVMDFFGGQVRNDSRDTEEAINKATEWSKQYNDNWAHYVNADDFDYYSAKGAAIQNPTMEAAESDGRFLWWEWEGDDIGNIVTYSRENADMLAIAYGNGQETKGNYKYRSMKDVEVDIYNYFLGKEWEDKANEFLSFMDEELNAREGGGLAKRITGIDIPVVEDLAIVLYGFGAGIDQWISGAKQLFTNELLPTTVEQYANSEIADSLNGIGKYAYAGANVIGNMAPSILLSYVTAGLGAPAAVAQGTGAAAVGMSTAGNAYGSALRDGYSIGQARAYSTLVGAAEATLQYILGGIGSLGGITDDLIKAKINMIDNSLLRIAAKLGVDVFSEVTEEELQNFLEPAFRSIIFGEKYDAPTIDEMLETAVVTAGTTLLLGGGDTVSNDLRENGQLNATVQVANNQANAAVNQEAVAKSLRSKGVSSKKADGIAEAIVARLNGQELTRTQRELLSVELGSPTVQNVISELIQNKSNGIDSAQHNVYDEISAIGGNAATEGSARRQDQNMLSDDSYEIGADVPNQLKPQNLMEELASSGVKYNLDEVIAVTKTPDGNLLWLEQGNTRSGLTHILERHAEDFASQGVDDIPQLLNDVVKNSPIKTGSNSKGLFADYVLNGNTYRVAFGTNGYIVSFYPID